MGARDNKQDRRREVRVNEEEDARFNQICPHVGDLIPDNHIVACHLALHKFNSRHRVRPGVLAHGCSDSFAV